MGKIIFNNKSLSCDGGVSLVYVSERASADEDGLILSKDYLKSSNEYSFDKIIGLEEQPHAGFHNSFFRGKNITYKIEDGSIWTAIRSGTFSDLFVGDYFFVNNHRYVIAGFNIYLNNGDTAFTDNHIVVIPDINVSRDGVDYEDMKGLYTGIRMNSTASTTGGYINSYYAKTNIPTVNQRLTADFNSHLCTFREFLENEVSESVPNGPNPRYTGAASNWAWVSVQACLLNEIELFGCTRFSSSGYAIGTGKTQLPLFKFNFDICAGMCLLRTAVDTTRYVIFKHNSAPSYGILLEMKKPTLYPMYALPRFCLKG